MNQYFSAFLFFLQISFSLGGYCRQPGKLDDSSPKEILYLLFLGRDDYRHITYGQLSGVPYNKGCPIVFLTHGFMSNSFWLMHFKDKVFEGLDCANVISIDWTNISSTVNYANLKTDLNMIYPYTAYRTCSAGRWVADFIIEMHEAWDVPYSSMLLAGHSLGAHLFGCAGQAVKIKTGGKMVDRIIGLDPAGPMFSAGPPDCRLSDDDAEFVDTVRTDVGFYGYIGPLGHVDYYPNGGTDQPGCENNFIFPERCNHGYVTYILPASFVTGGTGFESRLCTDYVTYRTGLCDKNPISQMGYYSSRSARGSYYLDTTGTFPYTKNGGLNSNKSFRIPIGRK